MTRGKITGAALLAAWLSVHGFFMFGYMSRWEALLKPSQWDNFSTTRVTGWGAAGLPVMSVRYPEGWMFRPGASENSREDMRVYFFSSPYEQVFAEVSSQAKYSMGTPSLHDVYEEAVADLRKKYAHFTLTGEPSLMENKAKGTFVKMNEFRADVSYLLSSVKLRGVVASYDGLNYAGTSYYGATAVRRPVYFVATAREKYFENVKSVFLQMLGSVTQ